MDLIADRDGRMDRLVERAMVCEAGVRRCRDLARAAVGGPGGAEVLDGLGRTAQAYVDRQREYLFHARLIRFESEGAVVAEMELIARGLK